MSGGYPIPAWRVTLDGTDLTERMRPRLLELTITEPVSYTQLDVYKRQKQCRMHTWQSMRPPKK